MLGLCVGLGLGIGQNGAWQGVTVYDDIGIWHAWNGSGARMGKRLTTLGGVLEFALASPSTI